MNRENAKYCLGKVKKRGSLIFEVEIYENLCYVLVYTYYMKIEVDHMNKTELVKAVSTQAELTQKDAAKAVEALFETISNTLAKEEKIQLIGFGTFEVRDRAARTGRNPQTGEEIEIAASKVPAFKPGKELKEAVK